MKNMQAALFLAIAFIVVIAVISIWFVLVYNGLVKSDKAVDEAKAQMEIVLQRRLDLVPNLVETVKAYAVHERETLVAVTKARSEAEGVLKGISSKKYLSKEDAVALAASQSHLMSRLRSLFAVVEKYPDLKASQNFLALQDQLEGTENRIAIARQRYNYAARVYNAKITVFPGNIVAPIFGFQEKPYFEAEEKAQESVRVRF